MLITSPSSHGCHVSWFLVGLLVVSCSFVLIWVTSAHLVVILWLQIRCFRMECWPISRGGPVSAYLVFRVCLVHSSIWVAYAGSRSWFAVGFHTLFAFHGDTFEIRIFVLGLVYCCLRSEALKLLVLKSIQTIMVWLVVFAFRLVWLWPWIAIFAFFLFFLVVLSQPQYLSFCCIFGQSEVPWSIGRHPVSSSLRYVRSKIRLSLLQIWAIVWLAILQVLTKPIEFGKDLRVLFL